MAEQSPPPPGSDGVADERARIQRGLRALAFLVLFACMIIPPFTYHILHVRLDVEREWYFKGWVMMHGKGIGICDVRVFTVNEAGEEVVADRYEILGTKRKENGWYPDSVRRIRRKQLKSHVRRICRGVDEDVDLRVRARCAERPGWVQMYEGEGNVCTANRFPQRGDWTPQ